MVLGGMAVAVAAVAPGRARPVVRCLGTGGGMTGVLALLLGGVVAIPEAALMVAFLAAGKVIASLSVVVVVVVLGCFLFTTAFFARGALGLFPPTPLPLTPVSSNFARIQLISDINRLTLELRSDKHRFSDSSTSGLSV